LGNDQITAENLLKKIKHGCVWNDQACLG